MALSTIVIGRTTRRIAVGVAAIGLTTAVAATAFTAGAIASTQHSADVEQATLPVGLETTSRPTTSRPTTSRPTTSRPAPRPTTSRPNEPTPDVPDDTFEEKLFGFLKKQMGDKANAHGVGAGAWGDSELVAAAYKAAGVDLPVLDDPYGYYKHGKHLKWGQRKPGDLVIYTDHSGRERRVGIVAQNVNNWIISRPAEGTVKETPIYSPLRGTVVIRVQR